MPEMTLCRIDGLQEEIRMLTSGDNRVPAKHFLGKSIYVWQMLAVGESRKPVITNDGIDLRLSFLHNFWVKSHGEEEGVYG
jgi:hypothetical protein